MALADQNLIFEPNLNAHIMVVYRDRAKLDDLVFSFLNEGLKRKQFCVYSTVNLDHSIFEKISQNIIEFEDHIKKSNLTMVDLKPYLLPVMAYDLTQLKKLKRSVSNKLRKRANKNVRIYGDLVSHLYENKHYEECFFLEKWLQKNPFHGTKICPYEDSILNNNPIQKKHKLFGIHDSIIVC